MLASPPNFRLSANSSASSSPRLPAWSVSGTVSLTFPTSRATPAASAIKSSARPSAFRHYDFYSFIGIAVIPPPHHFWRSALESVAVLRALAILSRSFSAMIALLMATLNGTSP